MVRPGAWDALRTLERDPEGNAAVGHVVRHGCRDTLLYEPAGRRGRPDHVVVVETPDAVLVPHKRRTQEVKAWWPCCRVRERVGPAPPKGDRPGVVRRH